MEINNSDKDFDIFQTLKRNLENKVQGSIDKSLFGVGLILGTYNGSTLKLDNFKHELNDFLILHYLTLPGWNTEIADNHIHAVINPFRLSAGDRVLVARIGNTNVIVGKVGN